MYIVVNGGGAVGFFLAGTLHGKGHTVAVVEQRSGKIRRLAEGLPTDILVIHGDGCDPRILRDAGVDRADVFAAVTRRDEVNLISCQLAREHFGVKRAVARVSSPRNEPVFHALGIEAISSTSVIGRLIEEEVSVGDIIRLSVLQKGELALVEIEVSPDSPVVGLTVAHLGLPEDVVLVSITRGQAFVIPRGGTTVEPGDRILAVTRTGREEKLARILRPNGRKENGEKRGDA